MSGGGCDVATRLPISVSRALRCFDRYFSPQQLNDRISKLAGGSLDGFIIGLSVEAYWEISWTELSRMSHKGRLSRRSSSPR